MSPATAGNQGTLRGLRTFRLTSDGHLAPVTHRPPWAPGTNTAVCDRRRLLGGHVAPHPAPAPGCTCGLWAYGNLQALRESGLPGTARVVAVIGAHGTTIPATLGFRAEHATVEALWLSPRVPARQRDHIARHYPTTALYRSLPGMLAEHPCGHLPTYRLPAAPRRTALLAQLAAVLAWALAVLTWWATTPLPTVGATTPASENVAVLIAATPLVIAGAGTLLLAQHPRRWPWHLALLLPQTALLVVGQHVLDDVTAAAQLTVAATTATLMHTISAALAAGRLLRLDVRRLLPVH